MLSLYCIRVWMISCRTSFTYYPQMPSFLGKPGLLDDTWTIVFIDCDCEVKVEVNAGWGFGQCQLLSAACHFLWNLGQTTPGNKQQETSHAFVSVSKLFLFFSSGWLPSEMQRVHSENSSQSLARGKIISCKWEDPEKKWIVDGLEQT